MIEPLGAIITRPRRAGARRWSSAFVAVVAPAGVIGFLVLAWWIGVSIFDIPSYDIPTPLQVWQALVAQGWGYVPDIWTTTQEVLAGFGVGAICGLLLAAAMALWSPAVGDMTMWRRASSTLTTGVYPVLIFSQVVPIFVISVVVTLVFWQDGLLPQIVVTALYSFLPLVVTGVDGLERVDPDLVRLLRAAGASDWRIFRSIRIPSALPSILSGAKLAMVFAVSGAAISEWIGGYSGVGFYIREEFDLFQIAQVFAGTVVLTCLGAALFGAVVLVEYVAIPWNRRGGQPTAVWRNT